MIPSPILEKKTLLEAENFIQQSLSQLLQAIHSPSAMEEIWPALQSRPAFQDLLKNWADWGFREKEFSWDQCCREMERMAYATRPYCLRCGECCQKGSPTLYLEDIEIVRKGIIPRENLITLRQGETGFSQENQELMVLPEERLKVREKPGSHECLYYDPGSSGCAVYENRPLQCRNMECWNPENFKGLSSRTFLSRKDLLNPADRLLPVLDAHEVKCSLHRFRMLLNALKVGGPSAQEDALEIISYDLHLRRFLEEKYALKPEALSFLFGRPLLFLLPAFGFTLEEYTEDRIKLVPIPRTDNL